MKRLNSLHLALAALSLVTISPAAQADTRVEVKLVQFGGPETRTRCIAEWKTKGIPRCKAKGFKIRCEDTWISGCSEWATDFYQHEIFLVASGPDLEESLKQIAGTFLERALAAAAVAAAGTPGEVGAKTAAAIAAFKLSLVAQFAAEPVLNTMKDRFQISLEERGHW